jgi:hypothetical protein
MNYLTSLRMYEDAQAAISQSFSLCDKKRHPPKIYICIRSATKLFKMYEVHKLAKIKIKNLLIEEAADITPVISSLLAIAIYIWVYSQVKSPKNKLKNK